MVVGKDNKKKLLVSGPINTVRLEGAIGKTKKVLYVMLDFHMDINSQTQCEDIRAQNITSYLVEQFDRVTGSDKTYDFFMEIYPEMLTTKATTQVTLKYGWAIQELFKKSFVYDPKKNKVVTSTTFPNIRFHYIDIRAYIKSELDKIFSSLGSHIDNMYHNKYVAAYDIDSLLDGISIAVSRLKVVYDLLYGKGDFDTVKKAHMPLVPATYKSLEQYTPEVVAEINRTIVAKIVGEHKYDSVKKVFGEFINSSLRDQFHMLLDLINAMYKYLQAAKKKLHTPNVLAKTTSSDGTEYYNYWRDTADDLEVVSTLSKMFVRISEVEQDIMVGLVDLYFLRRFLNKDYITNGVIYTGALHSLFYVYMLVKYFDFKVTHASYSSEEVSKLNSLIKKAPSSFTLSKYFYPPTFNQCSDLTRFPPLFE